MELGHNSASYIDLEIHPKHPPKHNFARFHQEILKNLKIVIQKPLISGWGVLRWVVQTVVEELWRKPFFSEKGDNEDRLEIFFTN